MTPTSTASAPRALLSRAWALSPALTLSTGLMLLGGLCTTLGLVLDSRQLLGESVWLKPTKFYISLVVYNATLLYILAFLPPGRRWVKTLGAVLSGCGIQEMIVITLQAARGVRSHFNVATPFDQALYSSMGVAIVVLWGTMMVLAGVMLRAKLGPRPLASALRLGLVVAVVGMGLGFFMTAPHGGQLESLSPGQRPLEAGAHSFGGTDGGPGVPLVGWSLTAGDMRPAHFLGLHGLQVLPLLAVLLGRRRGLSEAHALATVRAAGVAYLGLTLALALQALRGQPVVSWDGVGMASLALGVLASLATWAWSAPPRRALTGSAA